MSFNKLGVLCKLINNLSLRSAPNQVIAKRAISLSATRCDLMEFFDIKDNWGKDEVKTGRSWTKDELRIKSNTDLHKLWYVLLKEKNMLLTMEEESRRQIRLFPNPERIDKIEDSMENLEAVVRERNVAYHQLETGELGERPGKVVTNTFGLKRYHKMVEYPIPQHMNLKWKENHQKFIDNKDIKDFRSKIGEQRFMSKKKKLRRDYNHVIGLLNRFPDMDMQALQEQYPDVDIEKAKASPRYGGHFAPR